MAKLNSTIIDEQLPEGATVQSRVTGLLYDNV
jgi:hypothetical protein